MRAFTITMIILVGASAIAQALHLFGENDDRVVSRTVDGFNVATNIALLIWGASVVWWPA